MDYRDPLSLLSVNRLDVFLKKLYFDVISGRRNSDSSLIIYLYRKHIKIRTGGVEPIDLHCEKQHIEKKSVNEYELAARELFRSIELNGFNQDFGIPISNELIPLNGSHRLAAAISLGLKKVPVIRKPAAAMWGIDWFRRNFSNKEYLFLIGEYSKFQKNSSPIVLWGITQEYWGEIEDALRSRGLFCEKVIEIDLDRNFDGFYLLLHQLYNVKLKSNKNIRRKAIIHGCFNTKISVLHVERLNSLDHPEPDDFFQIITEAKAYVRETLNGNIDSELYLTLHAPKDFEEKNRIERLLYSSASIEFHNNFQYRNNSFFEEFSEMLSRFRSYINTHGLSLDDICIVGSGVLGAAGIRMPADLDFVVSENIGKNISLDSANANLKLDILFDYPLSSATLNIDKEDLINNTQFHFVYYGIKFSRQSIVYLKKIISKKEKDLIDLQLMRNHRNTLHDRRTSSLMRDELLWLEKSIRGISN